MTIKDAICWGPDQGDLPEITTAATTVAASSLVMMWVWVLSGWWQWALLAFGVMTLSLVVAGVACNWARLRQSWNWSWFSGGAL